MRRSKKIFIPIIIGLLIITICIVVLLVLMSRNKNANNQPVTTGNVVTNEVPEPSPSEEPEEIDLSNVDEKYSNVLIAFADALSNTKDMENFLKDYVDPVAFVAYVKVKGNIEDFFTVYEEVQDTEVKIIEDSFKEMISKNDVFEVVKITDVEEVEEDNEMFSECDVTIRNSDGNEAVFTVVFFNGEDDQEIIISITDKGGSPITDKSDEFLSYFVEPEKKEKKSNTEDPTDNMSQQDKDIYNASIKNYIGEDKKGSEVKALIDSIITSNQKHAGEELKFISLVVGESGLTNVSDELVNELNSACEKAASDNSEDNIQSTTEAMTKIKTKINSAKAYNVVGEVEDGLYSSIIISEV